MEYLVFFGAAFAFFLFVFIRETISGKTKRQLFIKSLYEDYGVLPDKDYPLERFERIGTYYKKHLSENQIDDITWNDLDMDDLFKRMNFTHSAAGEEYLYYMLRDISKEENELDKQEKIVDYFMQNPDERVKLQLMMHKLGYTGKFSLYDYIDHLDVLGERNNKKELFVNFLYIPCIVLMFFAFPIGLVLFLAVMFYNILTYYRTKGDIEPYIISFVYVLRLLNVCKEVEKEPWEICKEELAEIKKAFKTLEPMKKGSFWFLSGNHSTVGSNPIEIVVDYIKMMFHVDLIQFNRIYNHLKSHVDDLDVLITELGYLESCVAIGAFRVSLQDGYCVPEFTENKQQLILKNAYHPMLVGAVKNSIDVSKGVLLTGSNASGKSTFLKTVALNAILAQTIHTCTCAEYYGPQYRIYSSMSLRDDLTEGESYFIVEIKAIKRILDCAQTQGRPVLCFVDEVLRGTNTIERIAAAAQILKGLLDMECTVFAATHDLELSRILKDCMDNYHFEEEVRDGDVCFQYKLLSGPTKTRNAIKLLEMLGFQADVVASANKSVHDFEQSGEWHL